MTTAKEWIERLTNEYDGDETICVVVWSVEDVDTLLGDRAMEVSRIEIDHMLSSIEQNHDASSGITWQDIEYRLDDILEEEEEALHEHGYNTRKEQEGQEL